MNKHFLILLVAFLPLFALGQNYPYEILPGQSKLVQPEQDTLWVLKHSQMQRAIIFGKENKLLKEEIAILKQKIGTKTNINQESDSLVALCKKDLEFYMTKHQEAEKDLSIVVKKYKRQKLFKNIFLGGMAASFLLGAYLFR